MPDETWALLMSRAAEEDITASEMLRRLIVRGVIRPLPPQDTDKALLATRVPPDTITGHLARRRGETSRREKFGPVKASEPVVPGTGPWTGFTPVPKPGKKR